MLLRLLLHGQRHTRQGVCVAVGCAGPVGDIKLIFLEEEHPPRRLTGEVLAAEQPLERLVVRVQAEPSTV